MIGTKISGRYELLSELGRGGMGVVYRARDPLLERDVAIKVVPPTLLTPDAEARFQREAQIVARMDHPAIVTVYDIGRHDGALFFVMPVVSGTTLRVLLRERSLRLGDVIDVCSQVADALAYSHAQGVIHRDIKPENIMVSRSEDGLRVRIMDFGLARASIESQLTRITQSGTLIGTVSYFSPEQVSTQHDVDHRSDLFSLGVVLYECLLGEPPFAGEVQSVLYRIVHEIPQPPTSRGADVDAELEAIAMHCLARDPAQRPASAREVGEALLRYRASLGEQDRQRPIAQASTHLQRASAPRREQVAFTGREAELGELQHRLNAALGGECQFVLVSGEAGIGKSRLLEELERLARVRRVRVLHGRFVEHDRAFPYQGFCDAIQEYFRWREGSTSSSEVADLSDLAPELVHLFPVLAEIGDIRAGRASAELGRGEEGEGRGRRAEDRTWIFELLARALARIASGRALVLLLEELHDADVSIEALQYIVRRLGPTPTLIVGTYRGSEVDRRHALVRMLDSFHGDRRFGLVALGPMTSGEHRSYVEALVGGARVGEGLARVLFEATEGNPFFSKELVRSLIDSGGIAEDEVGTLSLSSEMGLTSDALPETIQQVVEKQIERLGEGEREVLGVAAVLGRTFEYRDVEALLESREEVEEVIERLVRQGLLEEERESRGDRLSFASGVVREALYASLSRRKRRSVHRRYAAWLEQRHAGRLERVWAQLAHHYSQGDVAAKAVEYGLAAARKSVEAFSAEEAIRSAKTALEFLEDEEWDGERWLEGEARMLLARAYQIDGSTAESLREAERAVNIFTREQRANDAARALLALAEMAWRGRKIEQTKRWIESGITAARAIDDAETLSKLLSLGATVANLRGEYEQARLLSEEAEGLRPQSDDAEREIPAGGRLVVALVQAINATDPSQVQMIEEEEVLANVFERLFTTDAQGNLTPLLCEKWDVVDNGWTVQLTLRRDVRFSDGSLLNARDVKASFERVIRARSDALPAAFASIRGVSDFLDDPLGGSRASTDSGHVAGIIVLSECELTIQLNEPIPLYPALLTDLSAAVMRVSASEDGRPASVIGTGPFTIASHDPYRVKLERNPGYWGASPARLDAIEFRAALGSPAIASSFRSGELDLARGLAPNDLDRLLRDSRLRGVLSEIPQRSTSFVLFNTTGPMAKIPELRRALAGVVRPHHFVWRALGRFALPAASLIPPGMLGHDSARKHGTLTREQAAELIASAGIDGPIRLTAAVPPTFQDLSRGLLETLLEAWSELGVTVSIVTDTYESYMASFVDATGIDLSLCQWTADYDDPDNFAYGLFKSRVGVLRKYFSSPETDRIAEEARAERQPFIREALYRKFENVLHETAAIVPLYHATDYRIANSTVRGLKLLGSAPFVNYSEIGKVEQPAPAMRAGRGTIWVPTTAGDVTSLDPALICDTVQGELLPNVFETLTRVVEGARAAPWLASDFRVEEGGRRYRFHLREDVRFHDGRRLTTRDVRYSFERLLQHRESSSRHLLSVIRGAKALIDGEVGDLEGLRIVSALEFTIELERPLSFFAVMLTNPATAIVPEGSDVSGDSWQERAVGTGPFRVARFEPDRILELERNPLYWRPGVPKCQGLVFRLGLAPEEIVSEFRAGRLSLASDLPYDLIETLRHDPEFAAGYQETPRLSTAFIAFNAQRGPLADLALRRRVRHALDITAVLRRTVSRSYTAAHGLIPPGLLGYTASGSVPPAAPAVRGGDIELTAAVNTVFKKIPSFRDELLDAFRRVGVRIRIVNTTLPEMEIARRTGSVDMIWSAWVADYPDTDSIVHSVLHSRDGAFGTLCGSPRIDRLIEQGQSEPDPSRRHGIYRQIEGIIASEALLLPLFHSHNYRIARPEISGLSIGALTYPSVAYENLWVK